MGFNPISSGSITATMSNGFTGASSEETDTDIYSPLTPNGFDAVKQRPAWTGKGKLDSKYNTAQKLLLPSFMHPATSASTSTTGSGNSIAASNYSIPRLNQLNQHAAVGTPAEYSWGYGNARVIPDAVVGTHNRLSSISGDDVGTRKPYRMTYGTPSYSSHFDPTDESDQVFMPLLPSTPYTSTPISTSTSANQINNNNYLAKATADGKAAGEPSKVETLTLELAVQDEVNKSILKKLKALKLDKPETTSNKACNSSSIQMPSKYYQLFKDLTRTLNERNHELEETKTRLDAIMVGLVMEGSTNVTRDGTFDAQDLAHRITSKLCNLQSENDALRRMVSYSNKQSLLVELNLLREENAALRKTAEEKAKKTESESAA